MSDAVGEEHTDTERRNIVLQFMIEALQLHQRWKQERKMVYRVKTSRENCQRTGKSIECNARVLLRIEDISLTPEIRKLESMEEGRTRQKRLYNEIEDLSIVLYKPEIRKLESMEEGYTREKRLYNEVEDLKNEALHCIIIIKS